MSKKRWLAVGIVAAAAFGMTALVKIGFWDPDSGSYWRSMVQGSAIALAERLPTGPKTSKLAVRMAVRGGQMLPTGISPTEGGRIAALMLRHGDGDAAAELYLGLAHNASLAADRTSAIRHAAAAAGASPGERTHEALLIASRGTDGEASALRLLMASAPEHEIVLMRSCASTIKSFAGPVPRECRSPAWLGGIAEEGRAAFQRIVHDIDTLPERAAAEIARREREFPRLEQSEFRFLEGLRAAREDQQTLKGRAIGRIVFELLPFPQPGDTPATYLPRTIVCARRFLGALCAFNTIREGVRRYEGEKAATVDRVNNAMSGIQAVRSLRSRARAEIAYWQSSEPLEKLVEERGRLLPDFLATLSDRERSRYPHAGQPWEQTLTEVFGK